MKRPKKPKHYHLPVLIEQDEDGVSVPTLRGCRSYGHTLDQAMENITEAAALCLEDERPASGATFVGLRDLEIVAWVFLDWSHRVCLPKILSALGERENALVSSCCTASDRLRA